ncbi:MAG: hypothetical protein Q8796_00835 [Candidatus Phytoplasma australasiaticum]|nr:hypothetical protein [Candidatus Phytoplasma australasiaticum]
MKNVAKCDTWCELHLSLSNVWYDWFFNLFHVKNVNNQILLICLTYCLGIFIINFILSNILLFFILSKITYFFDKYL